MLFSSLEPAVEALALMQSEHENIHFKPRAFFPLQGASARDLFAHVFILLTF